MSRIRIANRILKSEGLLTLMQRLVGFSWEECVWLYTCTLARRPLIERTVRGHRMYLSTGDAGISRQLRVWGVYEPTATELLSQEIKPGMHVVEIGANIGYYTLELARLVGEAGEVIAIEPDPATMYLLKLNVEANGYENVCLHEIAIGPGNLTASLYLSHSTEWCSLIPRDVHHAHIEVPVRTLDSLVGQRDSIHYVKMDIEGYETEAIKGMHAVLQRNRPGIFVEIHPHIAGVRPTIQFLEVLEDLGYRVKHVVGKASDHRASKVGGTRAIEGTMDIEKLKTDERIASGLGGMVLMLQAAR